MYLLLTKGANIIQLFSSSLTENLILLEPSSIVSIIWASKIFASLAAG